MPDPVDVGKAISISIDYNANDDDARKSEPGQASRFLRRVGGIFRKRLVGCRLLIVLLLLLVSATVFWSSKGFEKQNDLMLMSAADGAADVLSWRNETLAWSPTKREEPPAIPEIWLKPNGGGYTPCIERLKSDIRISNATKGYLSVYANGGLNQIRLGISDMVAIAKLMNVTLVIPSIDNTSFWKDSSNFQDIFDVEHFIDVLGDDIMIDSYYKNLSKIFKAHRVVSFTHTDTRLANNNLSHAIQKLRCRANYQALRFTLQIEGLAMNIIDKLKNGTTRPFMTLHLRYEKDMLAFTGCDHQLGLEEAKEIKEMRYANPRWKEKSINGTERRLAGRCPMTPREISLFLKAMGYPNTTNIYIAAGEIYGANSMDALRKAYPNLHTHYTTTTSEEIEPFQKHQHKLAAIDYYVAIRSDVFVYTHDGNMARAVQGHRRFEGFLKTINPDRKRIVELIDQLDAFTIEWSEFEEKIRKSHANRLGGPYERKPGAGPKFEEYFYSNPQPGCLYSNNTRGGEARRSL
uniref:O-fucosyltransferase family protein n=1 Tax=Ananas comosus var. bracteatus TaxID=296719 RepID=A0A6V7NWF9_ANACO|nr:unnamed protein product [Ananas comosus var. bracteatus]